MELEKDLRPVQITGQTPTAIIIGDEHVARHSLMCHVPVMQELPARQAKDRKSWMDRSMFQGLQRNVFWKPLST